MSIFINKSVWGSFTEDEMNEYVLKVFNYYRQSGFPYFPVDSGVRKNEFDKLIKYSGALIVDDIVKQTMHGLSLAWSYMPHSWEVVCNDKITPIQAFFNDEIFVKVIRKRIKIGDNISDNGIRKMLKMFSGVQSVSNFRPTAAHAIYNKFLPNGGTALDMSSGFGGRLLGAIKSNRRNNFKYIGYEPSQKTFSGLSDMVTDFGSDMDIVLVNKGSEFIDLRNEVDFAFTSPPYFDTEKYSNESTQSYLKYPTHDAWLNGFMKETFLNVHSALVKNGYMAINIANVKSYKNLEDDTIRIAEYCGFQYQYSMKLTLSNSTLVKGKSAFKYEPILIFKK